MRMKLRYSKFMLAVSVAVLTVTSFLTILGSSASDVNEITLKAGKQSVVRGERINVSVGFVPDKEGAAGFSIELYYDPDKVTVHIPDDREAAETYNVQSKFSVITNYSYASGVIRIVGANLNSTNVTSQTLLSLASFDVKNNAEGDIRFSTEVKTLVRLSDSGYVNAPYSAGDLTVKVSVPVVTTTAKPVTTTTTTTTTPATTTTTTTTTPVTTTTTTTTTPVTTTTTTTTKPVTTTTTTTTKPVTTTTTTKPLSIKDDPEDGELFAYFREGSDFNSQESVYYRIPLKKYITDKTKHYDVKIAVQASGNANGGLSMMSDGEYIKQDSKLRTRSEEIWTLEDIDPMAVTSDIYVTLYYLKANSEFKVNSVEFVERAEFPQQNVSPAPAPEEPGPDIAEPIKEEVVNIPEEKLSEPETQVPQESRDAAVPEENDTAENADLTKKDISDTTEIISEEDVLPSQQAAPSAQGNEQNAETVLPSDINTGANGAEPQTDIGEDLSDNCAVPENSANEGRAAGPEAERIEKTVIRASQAAGSPDNSNSNPDTGSDDNFGVKIVMMLSGLYILWSLFTVLFNRIHAND